MYKRFSTLFEAQDMTNGAPMRCLLQFSIPLLIGNFVQQLYSTVDSIVVGKYVGDKALSSIGATLPVLHLMLVLFMAIATGAGVMVAQYYGAKDKNSLSQSVGNAFTLIFFAAILIMLLGFPSSAHLLRLINTPPEIFDMAHSYLTILLSGALAVGFYNILSGILRGLGNTVFPLIALMIASLLNIVLDVFFVAKLDLGVSGAALATILSQGVSAVLCVVKLWKMKDVLDLRVSSLLPHKIYTGQLLRLGLPAAITQGIFSMSMVLVQSLTNSMGYKVVTGTTAVMRIDGFAMMPNFTFGMAIATFVGQNVGADKMDRVSKGIKDVLKLSVATSFMLVSLLLVFGPNLIKMFTSTESIIVLGTRELRILSAGYVAMAVSQIFGGAMRGAGDTMPGMWISLFTTVAVRVPLAYIWAVLTAGPKYPSGSPDALFFSLLISWVLGAAITYLWYRKGKWREKSLVKKKKTVTAAT